ncbi:VOC family protein [Larsenimonas suaedae]|uniref:VOC family protein n=1 Tax=Larsenimonas suaedae TaxID=1851019 RepID=A0ABU1GWM4_9GAMM|nr:VOC family protein [Larsenimonas suaedae]MCM2973012.1 VOC family protein [Larsenimonas suaedae]MDR5896449.1 VOC family protein [Larsenimonas suaedae]
MLTRLDHLVLNVRDIERTVDFYTRVLGFEVRYGDNGRTALVTGDLQIKLHGPDFEATPKANAPASGSMDLCFITTLDDDELTRHFDTLDVALEEGPVHRHGAAGALVSYYLRDPDGNLIELARPRRTADSV